MCRRVGLHRTDLAPARRRARRNDAKADYLYGRSFVDDDHAELADFLTVDPAPPWRWLLSYDDHPRARALYAGARIEEARDY